MDATSAQRMFDSADIDTLLHAAINAGAARFAPGELAFLAATSKIEIPMRDAIALELHRSCGKRGYLVAREWHKTDIAILSDERPPKPVALIELKAMYSFDALRPGNLDDYSERLRSDEQKARNLALPGTAIFTVLLATHRDRPVADHHIGIVKYDAGINWAHAQHGEHVRDRAIEAAAGRLHGERALTAHGIVDGGEAFDARFEILYWLFRAYDTAASAVAVTGLGASQTDRRSPRRAQTCR